MENRPDRRRWSLIATAALVAVATVGIAVQGQPQFGAPRVFLPPAPVATRTAGTQTLTGTQAPEQTQHELRIDLSWLMFAAVVLAIVVALALIVRRLRRSLRVSATPLTIGEEIPAPAPSPAPESSPETAPVRRGLDLAMQDLAEYRDPRTAIERAWIGLEQGAAESGVRRLPAETPSEFTARVIARVRPDQSAARALLEVYQRARFSAEPVTPDDVATATAAVQALHSSWSTAVSGRSSRR